MWYFCSFFLFREYPIHHGDEKSDDGGDDDGDVESDDGDDDDLEEIRLCNASPV